MNKVSLGIAGLAAVLLLCIIFVAISDSQITPLPSDSGVSATAASPQTPGSELTSQDLKGTIYFSAGSNDEYATKLHAYDLAEGKFVQLPYGANDDDTLMRLTSTFANTDDKLAYFETRYNTNAPTGDPLAFFSAMNQPWRLVATSTTGTEGQILHSGPASSWPRYPSWSADDSKIVFMEQSPRDFLNPDASAVKVIDSVSKQVLIETSGSNPVWSPDGTRILFVRSDGIYERLIGDGTENNILNITPNVQLSTRTMLAVSPDGAYIVIATPDHPENQLLLYAVESWSPFKSTFEQVLSTSTAGLRTYGPVFSPDGIYVAVHEIERLTNNEVSVSKLVVYDIISRKSLDLVSLVDFNPNMTFLTDWE